MPPITMASDTAEQQQPGMTPIMASSGLALPPVNSGSSKLTSATAPERSSSTPPTPSRIQGPFMVVPHSSPLTPRADMPAHGVCWLLTNRPFHRPLLLVFLVQVRHQGFG